MAVYQQELDNMVRWRSFRIPFYEVYYLKLNFDQWRKALWLRYTLLAPRKEMGDPSAAVWAMYFDCEDSSQNLAVKETVALEQTVMDKDIFYFQVMEDSAIYNTGARGRAASGGHELKWDLQYPHNEESFKLFSRILYHLPFPKSKLVSPNWSIRPAGEFQIEKKSMKVEGALGCQAHIWGTQHAERWAWAHCNTFGLDGIVTFDALTARIRLGKKSSRPLTLMALRLPNGQILRFTRMTHWVLNQSRYDLGSWDLMGKSGHWRLQVSVKNDPAQMVGVTYTDTDGTKLYCYHGETASFHRELSEYRGGSYHLYKEWDAAGSGAYEVVERAPLPGMKLHL